MNNPKKSKIVIGIDMAWDKDGRKYQNSNDYSTISIVKQYPDGTIEIVDSTVSKDPNEFKEMRAYLKNKYPEAIEIEEI